ncbi:hypothetical protein ANTQUA_LOCUS5188 [Anthophora quadrimaculata]
MMAKKNDREGLQRLTTTLVLGLVCLTISRASSLDSANGTASIVEEKMEGRTDGDGETLLSTKPSTRSVEWKSGPFTRTKDSYLEALRHSRTSTDPREGIVVADAPNNNTGSSFQRRNEQPQWRQRQQQQGPVYAADKRAEISTASSRISYASPDQDSFSAMFPSDSYSLPARPSGNFAGGKNTYGPPQPPRGTYGPAYNDYSSSYGDYGAAAGSYSSAQQGEARAYGPATPGYGAGVPYGHGVPHGMSEPVHLGFPSIDFSWPFALKLNAFTLAKILLKLVIFKMIVKFIAVICLLLFIPKLEIKKKGNKGGMDNDDEEEGRRAIDAIDGESRMWARLNLLTAVVNDALEQHRDPNESRSECSTLGCRVRRDFAREQTWPDYEQLLRSYILEETRRIRAKS